MMMTDAKEMNSGVALLLERMKTHPEEFVDFPTEKHITSKWGETIADYKNYLEPEDQKALEDGLKAIHQQRFTEKVLEELVDPKKSEKWSKPLIMTSTHSAGVTLAQSTLNALGVGHTTVTVDPLVQAHIDAHKKVLKEVKPKTIFGRLFNYAGENK
jgi:hypothetical protein